jgi:D-serine deaminase-like pyridoxal phosphate-dependent protein
VSPATAIDTPAAVVDVERLDRNLRRWQEHCDRVGLANRPHIKTHKCVEIARRQLELGAVGLTCQKLGEAETMVDAGFDDVLVPYNLLGAGKLERLSALLGRAAVSVSVDDEALLPGLAGAAQAAGRELRVLVDCDTGLGRTGVTAPGRAAELASAVAGHDALRFDGFVTYPSLPGARPFLEQAAELTAARGLEPRTVSAGGTPSMWRSDELRPTVTEYRVGTYAFHDRMTVAAGAATLDDVALTVHATVVSRPAADRAVLDAGSKALGYEPGFDDGFGLVLEAQGSRIEKLNEEHAYVALAPGEELELGAPVRVVPNHVCVAVNLYDELVARHPDGSIERWRVDARGRSR